jgi:hypothetical protein
MRPAVFVRIAVVFVIVSVVVGGLAAVVTAAPPGTALTVGHPAADTAPPRNRPSLQPGEAITYYAYLPLVAHHYPDPLIIIDHTTTDISQIPPYWINQAKELRAELRPHVARQPAGQRHGRAGVPECAL